MLAPYPDFSNVHLGDASELQVCNWRHGRSRVLGARKVTGRRAVLFLWHWLCCDFGQPLAQQQEACPHIWESGKCLLLCGGKRHGFVGTGPLSRKQWCSCNQPYSCMRERKIESELSIYKCGAFFRILLAGTDCPPHFSSVSLIYFH